MARPSGRRTSQFQLGSTQPPPGVPSVLNDFRGGFKTEFTGLNFPANSFTSSSNVIPTLIGSVTRRPGINYELNFVLQKIFTNVSIPVITTYRWVNAGGDGASQILVLQAAGSLYFFLTSNATVLSPASATLLMPIINLTTYLPVGSSNVPGTQECQFADGNGYLFVFHPYLQPFYVQFTATGPAVTSTAITLQVRDFLGMNPEPGNPTVNFRPTTLNNEHLYNLQNQGWTSTAVWSTSSNTNALLFTNVNGGTVTLPTGSTNFTVATGLTIVLGTAVSINWSSGVIYQASGDGNFFTTQSGTATGTVTAYTSGTGAMTINVTSSTTSSLGGGSGGYVLAPDGAESFTIRASNLINTISTWNTQIGNYPSNADIWFNYIVPQLISPASLTPAPGLFSPSNTVSIVPVSQAHAPQGHFILDPFNMDRTATSGISSLTAVTTAKRSRVGTWFAGRVWYSGVDDVQLPTGDAPFYTWTENIYFSKIVTQTSDFGLCFQQNDPTDDKLFDLLPSDGGIIVIQGSGPIYKLFPIQNGMLVFAANGVWLIRGNSGIGFTANDYSINKISSVKSISSTSYVDVLGLPMFWNSEGIYIVQQTQQGVPYGSGSGGLIVQPITIDTILQFYNGIPFDSKRFARGTYNPITYVVSWIYRSTEESGLANRYLFDSVLNYNVITKAFYTYAIAGNGFDFIGGIQYIDYPTGNVPPTTKYIAYNTSGLTFAEENDTTRWADWVSSSGGTGQYTSTFTTAYQLTGQAFRQFQPEYIYIYSEIPKSSYTLQGIWNFAISDLSNRFSSVEVANRNTPLFSRNIRKHRIRGQGYVLQFKISSVAGQPFNLAGWAVLDTIGVM